MIKTTGMKKVLIITYYWPPSGGAGVQRWLKFTKYLRNYGWEPMIYTPSNPEPPDIDTSLLSDIPENLTVIRTKIWEPYSLYKRFTGKKKESRITHGFLKEGKASGPAEKIATWIRGNFFIPDARCFWIKPSIKYLTHYLKSNPVDVIVSTGPPHSMHLIAMGLKEKTNIPWLADFRDPWTEIDFFGQLLLSSYARKKHQRLEKGVLANADLVVTISRHLANDLFRIGERKIEVITNGFDTEDFKFLPVEQEPGFILTHIGSLNKDRNPLTLWETMAELCNTNPRFKRLLKLRFIGKNDFSLRDGLQKNALYEKAEFFDYMPHQQALRLAATSSALLLLLNNTPNVMGITPGKLFEYLALKRPILCIGPEVGDSANILLQTASGDTVGFSDKEKMKAVLLDWFYKHEKHELQIVSADINTYSREKLTENMASFFENLVSVKSRLKSEAYGHGLIKES
ncbi:MAG: glycosyltransferase [Bacteroidales bacterium]|nr:glycosyltransferase [Bacteroidales bacterium]